jgi:phosphatidylinositol-3-phosphatase
VSRVAILVGALAAFTAVGVALVSANGADHHHQPKLPRLAHVVVIVFENEERSAVIGGTEAPTFTRYAHAYADLTNYNAIAHPSLPNYLALVSGSTQGVSSDCTGCGPWTTSIGTSLARAGLSWGGYAEGYPSSPRFVKRHMPFLYFRDGASHVHPLGALDPGHLPSYAFVAPDLCHDAHDCPLSTADGFLARWLPPFLKVPRTAVFVIFDEGTTDQEGGGEVAAFVAGTAAKRRVVSNQDVTHYSLLRTVEDLLGLPHLGSAANASPIGGIWRSN